jgi:hypothetical protein
MTDEREKELQNKLVVAMATTGLILRKSGINSVRFSREELQQFIADMHTDKLDIIMQADPVTDEMVFTLKENSK